MHEDMVKVQDDTANARGYRKVQDDTANARGYGEGTG